MMFPVASIMEAVDASEEEDVDGELPLSFRSPYRWDSRSLKGSKMVGPDIDAPILLLLRLRVLNSITFEREKWMRTLFDYTSTSSKCVKCQLSTLAQVESTPSICLDVDSGRNCFSLQ